MSAATRPQAAAKASQTPGIARFPVISISDWLIAGVKPPKIAAARL